MALTMFGQTFGGTLFLSFPDTVFTNRLESLIRRYAYSVDPDAAGATGFSKIISGKDLVSVLVAYAKSVDRVFYLIAGAGLDCFIFGWGIGWKDAREKDEVSTVEVGGSSLGEKWQEDIVAIVPST